MTTQAENTRQHHRRAVRFFWCLLIGATLVSLVGNITHAVLPHIPHVAVQIGAAAVPPVALLAAVHGIALAVRAGASGGTYWWAVGAVAVIGIGAFAVSFLALRDLMHAIGYGQTTACIFPAIVDTTVAVATLMLVALGNKPARATRTSATPVSTQIKGRERTAPTPVPTPRRPRSARAGQVAPSAESSPAERALLAAPALARHADGRPNHAALAQAVVDAGATTKPAPLVASILAAHADGKALNRIASDIGIHHKTVSKIVAAAETLAQQHLVAL